MIKKLLLLTGVAMSVLVNAQTGKKAKDLHIVNPSKGTEVNATQALLAPSCFTISTITNSALTIMSAASETAVPGCTPNAGYVFGSNCYADKEKANYFAGANYTATIVQPSVSMVSVGFFKAGGFGTAGNASVAVNLSVYSGSMSSGPQGAALGMGTASLGAILAAQGGTNNNHWYYTFTITPAVAVPVNGFFASVSTPTTAGDTIVVWSQSVSVNNFTWEKAANGTWYDVDANWGGLKGNLDMIPTVCGNTVATAVSANAGISKNVSLMPNPTSGVINITANTGTTENFNVTITNALGQVVRKTSFEVVSSSKLSLDLSNEANGVYFVTVSNGTDKMVQRLILNK